MIPQNFKLDLLWQICLDDSSERSIPTTVATRLGMLLRELGESRPRLIEIGTGKGHQYTSYARLYEVVTAIDPMCGAMFELQTTDRLAEERIDPERVRRWHQVTSGMPVRLVVDSSRYAHLRAAEWAEGPYDIILVDGRHSPASHVRDDYLDYLPFMADAHIVVFDDTNWTDCREGAYRPSAKLPVTVGGGSSSFFRSMPSLTKSRGSSLSSRDSLPAHT